MNEEIIPNNADEVGCDCGVCDKCMTKDMVDTSATPENPSAHLNPAAGMKHPELHNPLDPMCKCQKCMGMKFEFSGFAKDYTKAQQLTELFKRDFSSKQREHMASEGTAMPDGSFPIANAKDLANAIRLYGHAKNPDAAKAHIKARAAALGLTGSLPDDWKK